MKLKHLSLVVFCLLFVNKMFAQLNVVNTGMTPTQMVQNVLVGGGVTVTNVTFQGVIPTQIGTFTTGTPTNLGMATGMILSSGNVMDAPGPNSSGGITTNTTSGSDADLALLNPGYTINDKAVIEFDFVPISDTIRFNYVFASDEYNEYVGSSFNDVFGFFLSGPGINGGMGYTNNAANIAIIPGTALPVTIDNVNNGANSLYYVDNDGMGGQSIEYDGFTVKLTAWRIVTPCLVYHIKIAVADAGDSSFDSAVFLEAGSFISNGVSSTTAFSSMVDTAAVRGCSDALITFTIPQALSTPTTINYTIGGTATNGVDYTFIPSFITIPAGQTTGSITIDALVGGGNPLYEYVDIVASVTTCQSSNIRVYIRDYQNLVLTASNDTAICQGDSATLTASTSGGIAPYSYLWNTGNTGSSITVSPPVSTITYTVGVSDSCQSVNEFVTLIVNPNPTTSFTAPPVCASVLSPPTINWATITWTGTAEPNATYSWLFAGNPQPSSLDTTDGPVSVYWIWDNNSTPNYFNITLTITNPSGCSSTTTNQIAVAPADASICCISPVLNAGPDSSVCGLDFNFNASISPGSIGTWSFVSGPGSASFSDINNTTAIGTVTAFGLYTFKWYGESGACNTEDIIEVTFLPFPNPIAGADDLICGINYSLQGNLPGGLNGVWTSSSLGVAITDTIDPNSQVNVAGYGIYEFIWTLNNGICSVSDVVEIEFFAIPTPNAGVDQTVCGNTVSLLGNPNDTLFQGLWTGPNGTLFNPNDTAPGTQAMILPFTSQHNETFWWHQSNEHCIDSDAVVVTFNPYAGSNQVSAGFDASTCDSLYQLHGIIQGVTGTGQWSSTSQVVIDSTLSANTFISIDPSTANYSADSSKYSVTLIWTVSNGGCTATDNVIITFYETPQADAWRDQVVCGQNVVMDADYSIAASVGQWSLFTGCSNPSYNNQTNPNTQIQISCYGIYTFIWREKNLYNQTCTSVDTIKIEFLESPTISAGVDQWVCGDTVYLHALTASGAGFTWETAPVTWVNFTTHLVDTLAQRDSITIASYYHTINDSINFIWREWNLSTLSTVPTTQCPTVDTVVVHFFVDHPAIEWVDSQVDSVQCGTIYDGLNTDPLLPPQGYGYWVDTVGSSTFTPNPFSENATANVTSYGMHHFYWVVKNGTRPNGTSICIDSSDVIPIRFIEIPVANTGGNIWEANTDSISEIKWDTACGNKYTLNPTLTGIGDVHWILEYSPNIIWFDSTHTNTSPLSNDTVVSTLYNSDQTAPPYYYQVILQLDNSILSYPPFSHSCIDRDTLRITFARIPTGNIEFRKPYCYGKTALLYPEFDPQGKPNHFTWSFNGGNIDSTINNITAPDMQNDSLFYVSWDTSSTSMFHVVSLVAGNAWGCVSTSTTDTIWEPNPVYPFDSVFATTCMQQNGTIKVFPSTLHPITSYEWLDSNFASNPIEPVQNNLLSGVPYHLTFKYEAIGDDSLPVSNVYCIDTITYIIPDTGKVVADFTIPGDTTHLIPGQSIVFYENESTGGKTWEWHFGDGVTSTAENPDHIYEAGGTFYVYLIAKSKEGCESITDSIPIEIDKNSELIVPNIFTPNGDNKNDYFQVTAKTLKSFKGILTNRWGKTIFEWTEWNKKLLPTSGWDGKINGNDAAPGVYYYMITAEGWDNIKYDLKGAFHLERDK